MQSCDLIQQGRVYMSFVKGNIFTRLLYLQTLTNSRVVCFHTKHIMCSFKQTCMKLINQSNRPNVRLTLRGWRGSSTTTEVSET